MTALAALGLAMIGVGALLLAHVLGMAIGMLILHGSAEVDPVLSPIAFGCLLVVLAGIGLCLLVDKLDPPNRGRRAA